MVEMLNNITNIAQALQNPQQFISNAMQNTPLGQNPMMQNAMDMYNRGDVNGLQNLVNNIARQKGTSVDEIRRTLGF